MRSDWVVPETSETGSRSDLDQLLGYSDSASKDARTRSMYYDIMRDPDVQRGLVNWLLMDEDPALARGLRIYEVRIRREWTTWLCTLKALDQGEPRVAFLSAATLTDLIVLVGRALESHTLYWKRDKYVNRAILNGSGLLGR